MSLLFVAPPPPPHHTSLLHICSPSAQMLSSQRTHSIPSPPSSAPHRHSPFRYSGRSQNHFSPSVSSPATPLPGKTSDFPKAESPQQLSSSSSECVEVLSLEELLPGGSVSSEAQSKRSEVSEGERIILKSLDPPSHPLQSLSAKLTIKNSS